MAYSHDDPFIPPPQPKDAQSGIGHHTLSLREKVILWQHCRLKGHDYREWSQIYREWISHEDQVDARKALIKRELAAFKRENIACLAKAGYHSIALCAGLIAIVSFVIFQGS